MSLKRLDLQRKDVVNIKNNFFIKVKADSNYKLRFFLSNFSLTNL